MDKPWTILNDIRSEEEFCDVILVSDPNFGGMVEKFKVHRIVMSSCSPYFRAMFGSNWPKPKDPNLEITIPGLSGDTLRDLVEFAYTRSVKVAEESCEEFVTAFDQFMVDEVVSTCNRCFIENLEPDNCIGLIQFANHYFNAELRHEASAYLLYHFDSVRRSSQELLELPFDGIVQILQNDDLNVKEERIVWETVLRWMNHNQSTRSFHLPDLLKTVRLGLIVKRNELEYIKSHPLVSRNKYCKRYLDEVALFFHKLEHPTCTPMLTPLWAQPRYPHEALLVLGGWSGGTPTKRMESYDCRADRWIQLPFEDPLGPRAYHSCVVMGQDAYIIGGFNGTDYFSSCRCFNLVSKTWRNIANMNARRCYVSVAMLNGFIYAMGGYDGSSRQNTVEMYDPAQNQWFFVQPMSCQRSDASASTLNNRIFIVGGFNGVVCLNSAEYYNPKSDTWTTILPMHSARSGVSCTVYRGHLYVIGGFNGVSRLQCGEVYNEVNGTWETISSMINPRSNFGIEVMDDYIYVIGGFNGTTTVPLVEKYDGTLDEWTAVRDMNVNRSALDVFLVPVLANIKDYLYPARDQLAEVIRREELNNSLMRVIEEDEETSDEEMEI